MRVEMHRNICAIVMVMGLFGTSCESNRGTANQAETPTDQAATAEAANRATPEAPAAEPQPAATEERLFGQALSNAELTPLAQITADPSGFAGKQIKTEGEIQQVCQRMGCWMEMRSPDGPAVRVPMYQHSFFLPKDVAGRHATIEGTVALRELPQAERDHLASEGAQVLASALEITATGVVIR